MPSITFSTYSKDKYYIGLPNFTYGEINYYNTFLYCLYLKEDKLSLQKSNALFSYNNLDANVNIESSYKFRLVICLKSDVKAIQNDNNILEIK